MSAPVIAPVRDAPAVEEARRRRRDHAPDDRAGIVRHFDREAA